LRLALRFEREALLFFHEMRTAVSTEAVRILDALIDQERGHVRKLNDLYRTL
jgi:rubrerythrin